MAFNPERLSLLVQPIGENGLRFYGYQTDDVEATIIGAGYATNAADYGLRAYDIVFISPTSGTEEPYILAVDTIDADGHATLASPGPIGDLLAANNLSDLPSPATARTNLGLGIGTNVQAYSVNLDEYAAVNPTAAGLALLDDVDASAQRTTLGLGTMATQAASAVAITGGSVAGITDLAVADGGTGASDAATARTNLGLGIGTNVQAYDADLAAIAALTSAADKVPYFTGSGTAALADFSAFGRSLVDDADEASGRTTLGIGQFNNQAAAAAATISASTEFIEVGGLVYQEIDGGAAHPRLVSMFPNPSIDPPASEWSQNGDWTIAAGAATKASGIGGSLIHSAAIQSGRAYMAVLITGAITNGPLLLYIGGIGTQVANVSGSGTYFFVASGSGTQMFLYGGPSATAEIQWFALYELPADAFSSNGGTTWWAQPFLGARQLDFVSMFGGVADGTDSLDAGVTTTVRGAWVTATAYALHDLVWSGGLGYRCIEAHTSGTFATDLSAAKWVVGAFSGTDNLAALQRMVTVHEVTGLPMYIPHGKYRVVMSGSANAQMVTLSGRRFVLKGEGELLLDDPLTASSAFNLFGTSDYPAAGATYSRRTKERFEIEGITFRGRWSHKPERDRVDILEVAGHDAFVIKNCKFYDIPGQISWAKLNESVWFANNICERIGAGALRSQDSHNRFVLNNRIRWTGDDSIDMHDRAANGIARGLTIMGNHLKQCEGIIALGCFGGAVTGNTIEISHGTPIVIGTVSGVEGDHASVNLAVYGNSILDAISASADGSTVASSSAVSAAIIVGSANASLSGGDYDGSTKVNDPIVDNDYYNDTRASNNVPQGSGIAVTSNVIKRTRPSGSSYSAWGEGLYFYKTGWIDPTIDAADFRTNGITIQSDVDNVTVTGNTIAGFRLGAGVFLDFTATGDFLDFAFRGVIIGQNAVRDCLQGVNTDLGFAAVTDRYVNIKVIGNQFDLDPYHVSAARTSATAGSWNSAATDAQKNWGVVVTNVQGWEIHNNTFKNLYNPIYGDDALANGDYLNNLVHCQPADAAYSASNFGVAVPRNGGEEFSHVIVDSTPTSATFEQIINHCPRATGAGAPPAGTYVRGFFMRNRLGSGTFIDASNMVLKGWLRMTTGTGTVIGTDWARVYTSHNSPAT